jgi:hypothetical protein
VRKEFETYNLEHVLQSIKLDILTLDAVTEYACAMVEEKAKARHMGSYSRPQQ